MTEHRIGRIVLASAVLILATTAIATRAHHANSAYDRTQTISITGTVTKWQFINPHVGIWLDVADEQGNVNNWSGEFQSVQDLYRLFRWNQDTFEPGDRVTIIGNPDRRPGIHSMWTETVVFADGTRVDVKNNP